MRAASTLALIIAFALALGSAHANMPPPEPFRLGITAKMNDDGLVLTSVEKGSKADQHGLRPGDVILGADRLYAKSLSAEEQKRFVEGLHVWRAELVVLRNGRDVIVVEIRA